MLLLDRLVNLISGLGTSKDKAIGTAFGLDLISKAELDAMYRSSWLARKIVDIVPFDMTREWRDWQAEEAKIEKLEEAERLLRVRDKVACALQRGRLYGGAVIYAGIAGQRPDTPLNIETVRAGSIEYLHVLHRWEITSGEVDRDPLSPFFGEPQWYEIRGSRQAIARIHPSRIIRFVGAALPDPLESGEPWGDPVLQVVYDAVQNAASSQQHIAGLLPEAKVDVIKVPGLSEALSTEGGTAKVTARFSAANQIKSMFNMLLLEGDGESGETWEQKTIQFGQFPDLMRLFLQVAAGAADIPVTRLLGQSPAGLNATGDADIRNYYDHLASLQNVQLRPAIDRLDEILIRHALGSRPADIYYEWAPLWQMSETDKATIAKTRAEATHIYAVDATIPAPVLHEAIRNQLIESGDYPGIEKAYKDFDAGLLEPADDPALDPGGEGQGSNVVPMPQRRAVGDAAPRTLYVSRPVTNAAEIIAWAKRQGFETTIAPEDLHVTIAFSRERVDWFKAWSAGATVEVSAGGARQMERFGDAIVLLFASSELQWRWQEFRDIGASWDHEDYQPHITITYDLGAVDLSKVEPYQGRIVLGPERFAEVDEGWKSKVAEA